MSDDTTKAGKARRGLRFTEMAEQTGQGLLDLAARLAQPVTADTAGPLAAAAAQRAAEAAALAAMLRAVTLKMAEPKQPEGDRLTAPDEAAEAAAVSPGAFAAGIASGLSNLARLAREPRAAASLPHFAAALDTMAADARTLAEELTDAEEAQAEGSQYAAPDEGEAPAPLDWEALKKAADATASARFRRRLVELPELDHAAAVLAHGARRAVEDSGADDDARRQAAETVAEANALLRQATVRLRGFAKCLELAEECRPEGVPEHRKSKEQPERTEARDARNIQVLFNVLTGAGDLARSFRDVPAEPVEAMLRELVEEAVQPVPPGEKHKGKGNSKPFAFDVAKAWSICAMEARRQARAAETGRPARAHDDDAREVAKAWGGRPAKDFRGTLREWARKHRPQLARLAEGRDAGAPPISDTLRGRLESFAQHIMAPGAPLHPHDAESWARVAEVMEARLAAMSRATHGRPRRPRTVVTSPAGTTTKRVAS
jgi:hypothetical protein